MFFKQSCCLTINQLGHKTNISDTGREFSYNKQQNLLNKVELTED